jgi:integral membrane protein
MNQMMKTAIGRLRLIGIAEGISFLLLLGIAMPLKYLAGIPEMVKWVGWIHGLLFVLYLAAVAHVTFLHRWSVFRVAGSFLASLLPFGTFVLDAKLRREEKTAGNI